MSSHPAGGQHCTSSMPPLRNTDPWEWTAAIKFHQYELGTSFSILLFLGPVPDNGPQDLEMSPNCIGSACAYNTSTHPRAKQDLAMLPKQGDSVPLNQGILKHFRQATSFEPDIIVPYLTKNLEWRVQTTNQEVVDLESLEITVIATPMTYPPDSIFPVSGTVICHNQITYGRPGGSRQPQA